MISFIQAPLGKGKGGTRPYGLTTQTSLLAELVGCLVSWHFSNLMLDQKFSLPSNIVPITMTKVGMLALVAPNCWLVGHLVI